MKMLSVHRFPIAITRQSLLSVKKGNLRQIVFKDGKWTGRGGSSRLQSRVGLISESNTLRMESKGRLLGPFFFTAGFTGSCFALASIWEYENMRSKALQFKQKTTNWIERQQNNLKNGSLRNDMNKWWNSQNLTEGQKLFYCILLANTTVFLAWKIPSMRSFMLSYFCSNPFARAVCWPMVFSTFSHNMFLHFGANMYVLHSFMNATTHSDMGKEQFLGFYLSAGVISSLASHIFKTALRMPGVSLGASGAIMGVLAYFCSQHPDAQLQIAFVPGFTFTADSGLKALLCFDTVGLIMRWKLFDHAAHLGGALFGLFWSHWGQKDVWNRRVHFLQKWHNFRNGFKSD